MYPHLTEAVNPRNWFPVAEVSCGSTVDAGKDGGFCPRILDGVVPILKRGLSRLGFKSNDFIPSHFYSVGHKLHSDKPKEHKGN